MFRKLAKIYFVLGEIFRWFAIILTFHGVIMNNPGSLVVSFIFVLISSNIDNTARYIEKKTQTKQIHKTLQGIETKLEKMVMDLNSDYPLTKKDVSKLAGEFKGKVVSIKQKQF